jgi:membrane protein
VRPVRDGVERERTGVTTRAAGYRSVMAAPSLAVDGRKLAPGVIDAFRRNGLMNFAAAISFQVILAMVPFLLFLLALLGFLHLGEVWRSDVAPEIRGSVSDAAYRLLDSTATRVLTQKQLWWVTAGFALAVWEVSSATRVTMTALDRIYGFHRRRGFLELFPRSVGLGLMMGCVLVAAVAVVRFVPLLTGDLHGVASVISFLVRWLAAAALLGAAVALVVRYGSASSQPLPWVTVGTGLVMVAWVGMSILFGTYVTYAASYGSVFGNLATFFVLLLYVYASSITFLVGVQTDACIRTIASR